MSHGHTSVFSRTACRHLLICVTGILIALGAVIFCQAVMTEDAQADPSEEVIFTAVVGSPIETDGASIEADVLLTEVDEVLPEVDEIILDGEPDGTLDDEDPAGMEDADETDDGEVADDEVAIPELDIDTENDADPAEIVVLSEDPIDPEPQADGVYEDDGGMEGIGAEEDDEPDIAGDSDAIENIKLRSGGVSADPMDVLLGVVAQHQRQGDNIQVVSSDPMTGRVVYATD